MLLLSESSPEVRLQLRNEFQADAMEDLEAGRAILIPLTKSKFAIINSSDSGLVASRKWQCLSGKYAIRQDWNNDTKRYRTVYLHRILLSANHGNDVDHKNGNGLDNRRRNLRLCSRSENLANSKISARNKTGFKGVSFNAKRGKYYAFMRRGGRSVFIGGFSNPSDAAEAYRSEAIRTRGEFARIE